MVGATCLVETRRWYLVFFSLGLLTKQATLLLCFPDRQPKWSCVSPTAVRHSERKVLPIIIAQSAVLGNLLRAETITDTQIWTYNDIRNRWICLWIAIPEICEPLTGKNILNGGVLAVLVEVFNSLCRIVLIFEEKQRNVIWLMFPPPLVSHLKVRSLVCSSRLTVWNAMSTLVLLVTVSGSIPL